MSVRAVSASLICIGVAGALAAPAGAGTVEIEQESRPHGVVDSLIFHARPGERNDLTLTFGPDFVRLEDAAGVTPGRSCVRDSGISDTVVLCFPGSPASAFLYLGDQGDRAEVGLCCSYVELRGGPGDDWLASASTHNRFVGGPGNDVMLGGGGNTDVFDEGERRNGSDSMSSIPNPPWLTSWVDYGRRGSPVHADLDGNRDDGELGERDLLGDGITSLRGGSGADRLAGDDHANDLVGGRGVDLLRGGAGDDGLVATTFGSRSRSAGDVGGATSDRLFGGLGLDLLEGSAAGNLLSGGPGADVVWAAGGADRIRARDGDVDEIRCGAGADRMREDALDFRRGCERSAHTLDRAVPLMASVFERLVGRPGTSPDAWPWHVLATVACPGTPSRPCAGSVRLEREGVVLGERSFSADGDYGSVEFPVSKEDYAAAQGRDPALAVTVVSRGGRGEVTVALPHLGVEGSALPRRPRRTF